MHDLLTRENITLALSIFGSVGTLTTLISSYLTKRKNLKIKIISSTYRKNLRWLILVITFENRSQLPISITSVSAKIKNKELKFLEYPRCVGDFAYSSGHEVIDRKFEYNLKFPVDIPQLSARSGYVLFELSPAELQNLSIPLTLEVHSTRGRAQQIELSSTHIKWI